MLLSFKIPLPTDLDLSHEKIRAKKTNFLPMNAFLYDELSLSRAIEVSRVGEVLLLSDKKCAQTVTQKALKTKHKRT